MAMARFIQWRTQSAKRFLKRVTPLTWLIWAALVSDLAAPGYLKFNLGITTLDASVISTEMATLWEVATDAPGD
ncbi:MAG: hypothetical protein ACR2FS_16610 [Phormidesmis sp.]